jgi:hypothetical protein
VIAKLDQNVIPAVLIIKLNKRENISDIKFLLDGQGLIQEDGGNYVQFLRQAMDGFLQELVEEVKIEEEESKDGFVIANHPRQHHIEEEKVVGVVEEDSDLKLARQL